MVTAEMEALCMKLLSIAPPGVRATRRKNYITFQVRAPRLRNAVTIKKEGVSFFTEDKFLLEKLGGLDLKLSKVSPDEDSKKRKYRFAGLTPETVDAHSDEFRKLFEESFHLKQHFS